MVTIAAKNEELAREFRKQGMRWLFGIEIEFTATPQNGSPIPLELDQIRHRAIKHLTEIHAQPIQSRKNELQINLDDKIKQLRELKAPGDFFMLAVHEALRDILREDYTNEWHDGTNLEVRIVPQDQDGKVRSPREIRERFVQVCNTIRQLGKKYGFDIAIVGHHLNFSLWSQDPQGGWKNLNETEQDYDPDSVPRPTLALFERYFKESNPFSAYRKDPEAALTSLKMAGGIVRAAAEIAPLRALLDPSCFDDLRDVDLFKKEELQENFPDEEAAPAYISIAASESLVEDIYCLREDRFEERWAPENGNADVLDLQILTAMAGAKYALARPKPLRHAKPDSGYVSAEYSMRFNPDARKVEQSALWQEAIGAEFLHDLINQLTGETPIYPPGFRDKVKKETSNRSQGI